MAHKKRWLRNIVLMMGLTLGAAQAAVVTSIRPLAFIASAITDGITDTRILLPDGASPHDFALRPSDIKQLRDAQLIIWIGPEMEAFMAKKLATVDPKRKLTIADIALVKPLLIKGDKHHDEDDEHEHHGEYNMHLWLSPEIAKLTAQEIHRKLLELMPQNKDKLNANLYEFEDKLAQSDKNIAKILASVQGKGYFVFHDAYGYFEKHYGLTPLGHFTVNPEIQPGAQRLQQIRTQLVEQKATCIFAEPQFRPAMINAIAQGTQTRIGVLDPLGMGIALGKDSYMQFLTALANHYFSCLK